MANLKVDLSLNKFWQKDENVKTYTYKDLGTDNFYLVTKSNGSYESDSVSLYDINTSVYDERAIENSLNNIFNFRLGQEVLAPEFGSDLHRYLYEPINKFTADKINRTIRQMLEQWEPRIEVLDIPIIGVEEECAYYITIKYFIPALGINNEYQLSLTQR
jgi:phage baseplate assembly protein W